MRTTLFTLFLLLLTVTGNASAAPDSCGRLMSLSSRLATDCKCEGDLKQFGIQSPYKNLKLAAICGYREVLWESGSKEIYGHFFLKGEQTFSGIIQRKENHVFGVELFFNDENFVPEKPFFYDPSLRFEISETVKAVRQFQMPELSEKITCWEARVSFSASEILTLPGDSDEAGNYVRGYKVLKIGKYTPCKNP